MNLITDLKERLQSASNQIAYCKNALQANLENWERKEYTAVISDLEKESESLNRRIEFLSK